MDTAPDISFDGWTLRAASGELEKDGQRIRLQDQPLEVLRALLDRPGEVVTREELIARLWPKGIVDFDTSLNTAVRKLRVALGDEADTPRYIETLPRRGYRFISTMGAAAAPVMKPLPHRSLRARIVLCIAIVALLVGAAITIAPAWRRSILADDAHRAAITSMAVLPFRPLLPESRNPALEFGMADTLITQLSNLPGLKVSPLSAVRGYDAVDQDPLVAGRGLQVAAVLDGSIQTDRQRVRVSARLLRVADGGALWSRQFDVPMSDIFSVQDAIAQQVVDALSITLSPNVEQRLLRKGTANADAYQAYVNGLYKWQRRLPGALEDFEAALRADPNYALAWAGVSDALGAQAVFGFAPPAQVFPRAKEAALKALALDPGLAQAHAALGHALVQYERRYAEGEKLYREALRENPDDGSVYMRLGFLHAFQGQAEQALLDMQRGQEVEPTTLSIRLNVALAFYLNRQYDRSLAQIRRVLELDPANGYAHSLLGRTLMEQGSLEAALREFAAGSQNVPGGDGDLGRAYARAGRIAEARDELARLKRRSAEGFGTAYDEATIFAALGDKAAACAALGRALEDHSQLIGLLALDPALDSMRSAPCYEGVRSRIAR